MSPVDYYRPAKVCALSAATAGKNEEVAATANGARSVRMFMASSSCARWAGAEQATQGFVPVRACRFSDGVCRNCDPKAAFHDKPTSEVLARRSRLDGTTFPAAVWSRGRSRQRDSAHTAGPNELAATVCDFLRPFGSGCRNGRTWSPRRSRRARKRLTTQAAYSLGQEHLQPLSVSSRPAIGCWRNHLRRETPCSAPIYGCSLLPAVR